MGQVIEVNFDTKQKVQKYVVEKHLCANCRKSVIFDSRLEYNEPYIKFERNPSEVLCKNCSILVKEVVEDEGWK